MNKESSSKFTSQQVPLIRNESVKPGNILWTCDVVDGYGAMRKCVKLYQNDEQKRGKVIKAVIE